ncbi:carboxypeptidase-like regulatory domain-containing protein [Odoribacter lunatus]|uniref:carboxypeptidase-like regulatory domain-containing protein n=1 Tax=Odoribacter lunatus TaxID=2941335 RepID=UPI0020422C3C|nr:carboxypeptidase-like regulatory domain-containing protein [Odoribacter lunatus]
MKKIIFFCLLLLATLLASCSKEEHEAFGTIYGVVSDNESGTPIGNATVVLSPGGITKMTGSDGLFEFLDVSPQQYTITVQKAGYQTNRKTVTAVVDEKIEANITLMIQSK